MTKADNNQAKEIINRMLWEPMAQQFATEQRALAAGDMVFCQVPEDTATCPAGEFCARVIAVFDNGKVLVQGNGLDTKNPWFGHSAAIPAEHVRRSI